MRTGHLFAGAGGGLYADLILGHRPVFAVEWDDYAAATLRERADEGWFPGLHLYHGDVRMFDTSPWKGRVDSIHAGFPCQDISVAGNGAGIEGERSGLWGEVVRVADAIRPQELFLENSPAITSRGLDRVLGDLAELGYDAQWCVLPASAVGAPHIRARWWCLARNTDTISAGSGSDRSRQCGGRTQAQQQGLQQENRETHASNTESLCGLIPYTYSLRQLQPQGGEQDKRGRLGNPRSKMANPDQTGLQEREVFTRGESEARRAPEGETIERAGWWATEPTLGRVANGVANRGNRIKALGNGQVPLQAAAAYVLLSGRLGT